MIDSNKRDTLKILTLSVAATAVPVWSVVTVVKNSTKPQRLKISIEYESGSNHGTVVLGNPTDKDIIVDIDFGREVNIPGGSLDVRQLMVVGPLHIKPGSSRKYQLPKMARIRTPFNYAEGYGHGDQGFPITDNVIITNALVHSDYEELNGSTPVFLNRLS